MPSPKSVLDAPRSTFARGAAPIALLLALAGAVPAPVLAADAPSTLSINLVNSDIPSAVQAVAAATGRNFIVDPRVKGQITLQFEKPVSPQQVYLALLAQLRLAGYAVVDHDGVLRVVPEADARLQTTPVGVGEAGGSIPGRGDQVVTQVFKLRNQSAMNLLPVLRPLISPNNTINADPVSNTLVVTEYADNLKRISRIVAGLDQPSHSEVDVIALRYAVATELAPLLDKLLALQAAPRSTSSGGGASAAAAAVALAAQAGGGDISAVIVPDAASNALIVRAGSAAQLGQIAQMVAKLDRPGSSSNIHVVYLKNANAAELARSLRAVLATPAESGGTTAQGGAGANAPGKSASSSATSSSTSASTGTSAISSGLGAGGGGQEPQFGELPGNETVTLPQGGSVYADTAMNALIINAPQPVFQQLQGVIDKLDVRRTQIYIQALIAEVDAGNVTNIGVQWQGLSGSASGNNALIGGTNFGTNANGNIVGLQQAISGGSTVASAIGASVSQGLNVGVLHMVGGKVSIGALASFLQSLSGSNILSAPDLMTMNNEEASLLVGENVPLLTGSYLTNATSSSSTSNGNPFQTFTRADIGLKLKIRPQITAGDNIKLDVYQEVSNIDPNATSSNSGPSFTKRTLQTAVLVDDGQTIALGGLMQNNFVNTTSKVPLLGDIPGLGALFRYNSRSLQKTDLIVFLRPVIVRNADEAKRVSQAKYDGLQREREASTPAPAGGMPDPDLPSLNQVLPAPSASAASR